MSLSLVINDVLADMPDFYSEPGFNVNRDYPELNKYETVDTFTGKLQLHNTDILIKGDGGMDLAITRSYTSQNSTLNNMWTMHLGRMLNPSNHPVCPAPTLYATNSSNPTWETPDGSQQVLNDSTFSTNQPTYISANIWTGTCDTSGNLTIFSPEGTAYQMGYLGSNHDMYPTVITDRNGNTINVAYTNLNGNGVQITSITTSEGTTLTFNYGPPPDNNSSYQVLNSITDGSGSSSHTWTYQYIAGPQVGTYLLSKVTRPDGTTWQYSYNGDKNGAGGSYQISSVTNPMGGVSSYVYGRASFNSDLVDGYAGDDVIVSQTITGVGTWNYTYAPSSGYGVPDKTTVVDPLSQTTTYQHFGYNTAASIGDVWQIGTLMSKTIGPVSAPVRMETYTYTSSQIAWQANARTFKWDGKTDTGVFLPEIASRTITQDGATYSTTYSNFDQLGNPWTVTEAGPVFGNSAGSGRTTNYTYNTNCWLPSGKGAWHQVLSKSVTEGEQMWRTFDNSCNVLTETRDGVTKSYTYDAQGDVASISYPIAGRVFNYSSYAHGIPQAENQPENISISRTVDYWGNKLSETNGNGYTTSYTYDGLNRVTSTSYPAGNPLAITYTPTTTTITRGTLTETDTYSGFGLKTGANLAGITQTYTYDPLFRKIFVSNPGSATLGTTFAYDQLNRTTLVTNADNSTKSTSYGTGSVTVTDENGNATTSGYYSYGDPDERFLNTILVPASVASANIAITRNGHNQITSITQNGLTREYWYSGAFYLIYETNPETGPTTYGRDLEGNVTSRTVGASGTTAYAYDLQNRLVSITYPDSTTVAKTYTKTSKLASVNSTAASRSYAYDHNDNLTGEGLTVGGTNLTASYYYNANDQLSSLTYPYLGRTVVFNPDVLGRPTAVADSTMQTMYVSNVAYWPSGQIQQISYGNGTVTNYGQNSRLWSSSFITQLGTGATYVNSSYVYDGAGNLSSISDTANPNFNRTFAYDAVNRLTGVNGPWGAGSVAYDGGGNILSQSYGATSSTYTYNTTSNLLSSISGTLRTGSYSYDAYGDIVSDGNGKTFTYDTTPNLTGYADTSGNSIAYAYDGQNKRVSVVKNGVTTYEFYGAGGNLLTEYTPSQSNKLVSYFYLGSKRIAQNVAGQ